MAKVSDGADGADGRDGNATPASELTDLYRRLRAQQESALGHRPLLKEIARRAGFSISYLSEVFQGTRIPIPESARKIALGLQATSAEANRAARYAAELRDAEPGVRSPKPKRRPHLVPPTPHPFSGRLDDLARLSDLAVGHGAASPTIAVVHGAGGMGKTWLVLRWANDHLIDFPDGDLYVDLAGFAPTDNPARPDSVLSLFLMALGVDSNVVPGSLAERVDLYRRLTAGRRLLVVLDNARDIDQVLPLLPEDSDSTVLITSRDALPGLVLKRAAATLKIAPLTPREATDVLTARLGQARVEAEPDATETVINVCGGLPLALAIVGSRAATHPSWSLASVSTQLTEGTHLDAFDTGEAAGNLRAVFSWSSRALGAEALRVLQLISLMPGDDFTSTNAANLNSLSIPQSRVLLQELENAALLEQPSPDCFHMHDLLREYAAELAETDLPTAIRTESLHRLTASILRTALLGERLLAPHRPAILLSTAEPEGPAESLTDSNEAMTWFDRKHRLLTSLQLVAESHRWDSMVWQLAWSQDNYHYRRGLLQEQLKSWEHGVAAAERLAEPETIALAKLCLGNVSSRLNAPGALLLLTSALDQFARGDNDLHHALAHRALEAFWARNGDPDAALSHAVEALRLFRVADDELWIATALNAVGETHVLLNQYDRARKFCAEALKMQTEQQNLPGIAATLDSLGQVEQGAGRPLEAIQYYKDSVAMYEALENTFSEADTLTRLGDVLRMADQVEEASNSWERALALYTEQQRASDVSRVLTLLRGLEPETYLPD